MLVSEALVAALKATLASGVTRYRVCTDSGLDHTNLTRFLQEGRDIRLSTVDALAEYLGLELRPKEAPKRSK